MKKLTILLLAVFSLMGCVKTEYIERETGGTKVNRKIIDLQVNEADWTYSNQADNNYYFASFDIPEITKDVYDNGIVNLYVEYKNDDGSYTMALMPAVRHIEEFDSEGKQILYTATIDAEYSVGKVVVVYTASDFFKKTPGAYHFVLKMLW